MTRIEIGDDIPIEFTFATADGVLFDPLEVRFYIRYPDATTHQPSATITELIYGQDPELVRVSVGTYATIARATTYGVGKRRHVGLGTVDDADFQRSSPDIAFRVYPSVFTIEDPTPGLLNFFYYGAASAIAATEAEVLALPDSELRVNFEKTFTLTASNEYLDIAFPAAWGTPQVRFVDGGMPLVMEWTTLAVGGVSYNVGHSYYQLTCSESVEVY